MRGGISIPARLCVRPGELAPVGPKIAPYAVSFEELHELVRKLDEPVVAVVQGARVAGRVALEQRIIPVLLVLVKPEGERSVSGRRSRLAPLLFAPIRHRRPIHTYDRIESS